MHAVALALALAPVLFPRPVCAQGAPSAKEPTLEQRYHELAAKGDRAQLVEAWRADPGAVLPTIDADLEGSLALCEQARAAGKQPDAAAVAAMRARARFGAEAADEAFGTALFTDYAVAFASWNDAQAASFRAGQAAFGRARAAAKAGDHAEALKAAAECEELARPLGDWWGAAMGAGARGQALLKLGRNDQAVAALSEAALLNHDLRLLGTEYGAVRALAEALSAAKQPERERRALERACALAEELGDQKGLAELRAKLAGAK